MTIKVFVAQPAYGFGCFERESYDAPDGAGDSIELTKMPYESSLLSNGFNKCLCACLNGNYDYFVMLHADVIPKQQNWIEIMIGELEANRLSVIHAPCAIKDGRGLTSTAIAYSGDRWEQKRRLTTKELQKLPETFTIRDVAREVDPDAEWLLPNTGCLMFPTNAGWLNRFPGFEIRDKITRDADGKRQAHVVPEDWNFGYWCAGEGLVVGGTRKVTTRHIGKVPFMTEVGWGVDHDEQYFEGREAPAKAA